MVNNHSKRYDLKRKVNAHRIGIKMSVLFRRKVSHFIFNQTEGYEYSSEQTCTDQVEDARLSKQKSAKPRKPSSVELHFKEK